MKQVTLLDFRLHAEDIIARVQQGERLVLTRRGKPVVRLEPIEPGKVDPADPFFAITELASGRGKSLTNQQIDEILYGE